MSSVLYPRRLTDEEIKLNLKDDSSWRDQYTSMPQQPDLFSDTTCYEYQLTWVDRDPKTFVKRHNVSRWGDIYELQRWMANVTPTKVEVRKTNDTTKIESS